MPGSLTLTIGTNSVSVNLKPTNLQLRAAIQRYALIKGIAVEGRIEMEVAEDVLRAMLRDVRNAAIDRQRMELLAVQQATLEATIEGDNDLFDEGGTP